MTSSFCCADFGSERPNLSAEEIKVLDLLIIVGLGSEDLDLTDELLREYKLTPLLDAEVIGGKHIGLLGTKLVPSAFQISKTINSEEEG